MLGKLFSSNARVKILKLFLLNPESKYYIRQMSRDLKLQVNSVRRELDNLEKLGLLISKTTKDDDHLPESVVSGDSVGLLEMATANIMQAKKIASSDVDGEKVSKQDKKYYQVDTKFVLYEEIRSLIIKAQLLYEQDFIDKIMKLGRPNLFILSGFFVNNSSSSTDMLIVGKMNREKLKDVIKDLEIELGREVNYTVLELNEFEYRRSMTDMFIFSILEGKKIVIVDDLGVGHFS